MSAEQQLGSRIYIPHYSLDICHRVCSRERRDGFAVRHLPRKWGEDSFIGSHQQILSFAFNNESSHGDILSSRSFQ